METYNITQKVKDVTGSRKKRFYFSLVSTPQSTDSYWSGGSRDQYSLVNLNTGINSFPPAGQYPWTTENRYTLQPGDVLIQTGIFCGKPATPHIKCLPENNQKVRTWLGI